MTEIYEIPLTQGRVALVDAEDYDQLMKYNWHVSSGYAKRSEVRNGKIVVIPMQRQIMGEPENMLVDHINHDKLDNRRCNLRVATRTQNLRNRAKWILKTSKYKGVDYYKRIKRWRARIEVNGKNVHIGSYRTQEEAALAYNNAALIHHGEFAGLNEVI